MAATFSEAGDNVVRIALRHRVSILVSIIDLYSDIVHERVHVFVGDVDRVVTVDGDAAVGAGYVAEGGVARCGGERTTVVAETDMVVYVSDVAERYSSPLTRFFSSLQLSKGQVRQRTKLKVRPSTKETASFPRQTAL